MPTSTELKRIVGERVRAVDAFRNAPDEEPRRKAWDAVEGYRSKLDEAVPDIAARIEALEADAEARAEAARAEAASLAAGPPPGADLPVDDIRAVARGERSQTQFMMPLEMRTDFTTSDSTTYASYTVPQSWASEVINFQIASSGLLQAGPTIITTAGGNQINMPALVTDATTIEGAEGTAATVSHVVFGTRALNANRFDGFFSVANELLDDTGVNLVPLLRDYAGRSISAKVNPFFTDPDIGTGGSGVPQAVQVGCTSGVTANAYTVVTLDEQKELFYSVLPVYRARGKWVGNSAVTLANAQSKDGEGNYIWSPALRADEADTFMGKPWYEDAYMDTLATGNEPVIFGDIAAGYTIRYAHGGMQFIVSKEFAVTSFETTFVWGIWVDAVVTDAIAIKSVTLP